MERQIITVDISPQKGIIPRLKVSQGDIGRPLGVNIIQDGVALDCSTYTADLYVLKSDGNYFVSNVTIDSTETNLIKWDTAEQETIVSGECAAQIRIMKGSDDIGTARFVEYVEASPGFNGAGSESAVESIKEYVRQAAASAETASSAATSASTSATTATGAASSATSSATAAAGSASSAHTDAETASQAAQTAQDVAASIPADYSQLSDDVTGLMSALNHTDSILLDVVEDAIAENGYEQQTGIYIYAGTGKISNTAQAALANCTIAVKIKPHTTYLVQKSPATVLRAGAFMTNTAVDGNPLYPYGVREAGSTDPIEIYTGRNQYIYIQLWASSDPADQQDVATQLKTLTVTPKVSTVQEEINNTQSALNFVDGNILVNGYTELENLYIGLTNMKIVTPKNSYVYNKKEHRLISVPISGGRTYRVWCSVPTSMRAGSGTEQTPTDGYTMSTKVMKDASVAYMDVPTLDSDTYLYVQLFTDSDDLTHAPAYYIPRMTICPVSNISDTVLPDNGSILKEINHRGYNSVAPENTIYAFRLSKIKGFNWVETDIHKTSDGVIVCLHDSTINRTARNADGTVLSSDIAIADITYADALNYDFGIWKSSVYAGTKIPTLAETLALCKAIGLDLTIEIKVTALATADLIALVARYGMTDHVEYIGNKESITAMAAILHNGRIGLVGSDTNCNSDLRAYLESVRINGNEVYYHTDIYNADATRRAILDDIAEAGFIVVSRVNSDTEVANAPTYSTVYMTNATHARQYLYDVAMGLV